MAAKASIDDIQEIMVDVFDLDDLEISPATSADDIEEWDSLSHIRLIVATERHYGIKFTNAEVEGMRNVGDLISTIDAKLG